HAATPQVDEKKPPGLLGAALSVCASLTSPLWGDRHAAKMVGRALLLRYTLGGLCTTFERLQYLPRNFSDSPASV
ncbi:hypothetical protein ACI3PL_24640, partial [Lacticaseibacillus paracasei]